MTTPFSSDQVGWRRATINSLVGANARGAILQCQYQCCNAVYCSASASSAMLYLHPVNIMPLLGMVAYTVVYNMI